MLRTVAYSGADLFATLRGAWSELVGAAPSATPFQTFEWHSIWWRHFGGAKRPVAFGVYEGDDLVGLWPGSVSRVPWRVLRPMGLGPSDYLHPLARAGYEGSVSEALAETFAAGGDWDLVDLHQVREEHAFSAGVGEQVLAQATCLVLDLPGDYETYVGGLSRSLRYDVRRLAKTTAAEIVSATQATANDSLDILFDLHQRRWRKRGLPGAFFRRTKAFHREWAQAALANGWLRLSTLRWDGAAIGAIYGMALGGRTYYYQAGFDPERGAVSPGTLMVADTIRRAIEEGQREFDFMRGDEPYKRRWKPQHVRTNHRLLRATTAHGQRALAWNTFGNRMELRIRHRLEGRGLR